MTRAEAGRLSVVACREAERACSQAMAFCVLVAANPERFAELRRVLLRKTRTAERAVLAAPYVDSQTMFDLSIAALWVRRSRTLAVFQAEWARAQSMRPDAKGGAS